MAYPSSTRLNMTLAPWFREVGSDWADQKIVIGTAVSYHPIVSWPSVSVLSHLVKRLCGLLGIRAHWMLVMTQEPFDFAN
jgi:hypothetical protein